MIQEREPKFYVAPGKKGVGKTYTTIQVINAYVQGNRATGAEPRKVLILDTNNEYSQYKRLAVGDIMKWTVHPKIEVRRISVIKPNGETMDMKEILDTLKIILKQFRGGLLVIEDISKFTTPSLGLDLVGKLTTQRHVDCDIITHYQSIGRIATPSLISNTNIVRLHKTTDSVSRHENKFEERSEILKIGEKIIDNYYKEGKKLLKTTRSNKRKEDIKNTYMRRYCYIDLDDSIIYGNFTEQDFKQAITDYIQDNERDTIKKYEQKKDRKGKRIFTYETALMQCEKDLFDEYYGNK